LGELAAGWRVNNTVGTVARGIYFYQFVFLDNTDAQFIQTGKIRQRSPMWC